MQPFPLELDHVSVWVSPGAPEARALQDAGLNLFAGHTHLTGNGTSCVVAPFENGYLELVYLDPAVPSDEVGPEELSEMGSRTDWRESGASPFAIGLRRVPGAPGVLPFPARTRTQSWMDPGSSIEEALSVSGYASPVIRVVPSSMAMPPAAELEDWQRERCISRVRLVVTGAGGLEEAARLLNDNRVMCIETGPEPLLELTLGDRQSGGSADLRPALPIVLYY